MLENNKPPDEMHVLPCQRIGYDAKQRYTDWLAKLASEGYLTHEEWETRKQWVMDAKTEEELKVAFKDLPSMKYYVVKKKKQPWYEKPWLALPLSWFLLEMCIQGFRQQDFIIAVWLLVASVFLMLIFLRGRKK